LPVGDWTPGYVALALEEVVVGCGYFNGRFLAHQLSKVRTAELAEAFGLTVTVSGEGDDE
jgi:predicted acyltransferase